MAGKPKILLGFEPFIVSLSGETHALPVETACQTRVVGSFEITHFAYGAIVDACWQG